METELRPDVITLDIENLPEFKGIEQKQYELVTQNPYVAIVDNATYEQAKKARTALRKGRTDLQNGEKAIASKLQNFRNMVKDKTMKLIAITQNAEERQQSEIDRYETIKEQEREEKARKEKERINSIFSKIDLFKNQFTLKIQSVDLINVGNLLSEITEHSIDVEEFDNDYEAVRSDLIDRLKSKNLQLEEAERLREQRAAAELERKRLEQERAILEAERWKQEEEMRRKQAEAAAALQKEREAIEAEKQRFAKEQAEKEAKEQELAELKRKEEEQKEIEHRVTLVEGLGFVYIKETQILQMGRQIIELNELKTSEWVELFEQYKSIAANECEYLEGVKPDKTKLYEAINSISIEGINVMLNTEEAQNIMTNMLSEFSKLKEKYTAIINQL